MNCLVLEQGDDIVVIDCGVTFPTTDNGVDVLHPRFDYLLERADRVRGVVITHGHEDHIGALPYLLDVLDVPVRAPEHAMSLIKLRLEEHELDESALDLATTRVGEPFRLASFDFESIRVTHSIADATALAIGTCAGRVIHTGDFKLDAHPADGELTDEKRLRELGDEGVCLLLSDSTNIDSPGTSTSEREVGASLERLVTEATGRVVVGLFASNVQRLLHLGRIAQTTGRKVCLLGRSMTTHVRVAHDVERMRWPSDLMVSPDVGATLPPHELLVIATGTQAEPPAALFRLAHNTHPRLKLEKGDTVILSSRIIPGNDRPVFDMMSGFLRLGVTLKTRITDPKVHASGHAHREEQRRMLELVRPRAFMPVHGTLHHLCRHAELAREMGVEQVTIAENGDLVEVGNDAQPTKVGRTKVGRVATFGGSPLADEVLRERSQIGRVGVATVGIVLGRAGELVARPSVSSAGVLAELDADVLEIVKRSVERAVREFDARSHRSEHLLHEAVRLSVRRAIEAETGQRPLIQVTVTRVGSTDGQRDAGAR